MPRIPLAAVVFDFDGTLAELTIDFEDMKRRLGALAESFLGERPAAPTVPVLEWLDELAAEVEALEGADTGREFHTRGRFLILTMEHAAARAGGLFEYTRPALAELRALGLRTGIVTRNSHSAVALVFPDWREHTDLLLAREDAAHVKPHPGHLLQAMQALGSEADRTLMVGDHPLDMATARAAGTMGAGVASGRVTAETLLEAGADLVARDIPELVRKLREEGLLA